MMKSIMRVPDDSDIDKVIQDIQEASWVKVTGYRQYMGWIAIEMEHGRWNTCPKCGKEIHAYGHGLCLSCWQKLKSEIGAIS